MDYWVKALQTRKTGCCGSCSRPLRFNAYIYASDDPVNQIDPTGREAMIEYLLLRFRAVVQTVVETEEIEITCEVACQFGCTKFFSYDPVAKFTCIAGCKGACTLVH